MRLCRACLEDELTECAWYEVQVPEGVVDYCDGCGEDLYAGDLVYEIKDPGWREGEFVEHP